jgi:hypothetical protein
MSLFLFLSSQQAIKHQYVKDSNDVKTLFAGESASGIIFDYDWKTFTSHPDKSVLSIDDMRQKAADIFGSATFPRVFVAYALAFVLFSLPPPPYHYFA